MTFQQQELHKLLIKATCKLKGTYYDNQPEEIREVMDTLRLYMVSLGISTNG